MKTKILTGSMIAAYALLNTAAFAEEATLDPIVVSADFREAKLSETSNSVTVIGEDEIYDKASAAFEDVIGKVPNVNFTSAGSRAHHIQIRGIGERSQFQYPLNPSVGINIDGMDFSNSALAATLFDVKQIEVLKGPQGTTFGANGMAGVINIQSNEPTKETEGHIEATAGNYNTKAFGAAVGGTLVEDTLLGRLSIYSNTSDGFMENITRGDDDTNNIDELTAKAQLRWFASENHTIDLKMMHLDIDNGYDAWTLDNSRVSHSDFEGQDTQKTNAFSLKSTYGIDSRMKLISSLDWSDTDSLYSFENDWSNTGDIIDGALQYVSTDSYDRTRKNVSIDVRLVSDEDGKIFNGKTDWTVGAYHQDRKHTLYRFTDYSEDYLWGPYSEATELSTDYKTKSTAIYGQLDTALSSKTTLITGLRVEKWDAEYSDNQIFSDNYGTLENTNLSIDNDEVLYGGKLGLNYQADENTLMYVALSKGYKPGGVNIELALGEGYKTYETEALWNFEAGMNSSYFDNKLISRLNFFYAERRDQQIDTSVQIDNGKFIEYLSNAAQGHVFGVESELDYYPTDFLHLYSRIGLMKSKFDEHNYDPEDEDANPLEGREQAQSPNYQYNIGLNYNFMSNWRFNTNIEGKDSYYASNSHNEKISSYTIGNAALSYIGDNWSVNLWVRNITDKDYAVKAFYFDNKIVDSNENGDEWDEDEFFTQKGAPRTFGLTVSYDF